MADEPYSSALLYTSCPRQKLYCAFGEIFFHNHIKINRKCSLRGLLCKTERVLSVALKEKFFMYSIFTYSK